MSSFSEDAEEKILVPYSTDINDVPDKIAYKKWNRILELSEKFHYPIYGVDNVMVSLGDFKSCPFCGKEPVLKVFNPRNEHLPDSEGNYGLNINGIYVDLIVECPSCENVSMTESHTQIIMIDGTNINMCFTGLKDLRDRWNKRKN